METFDLSDRMKLYEKDREVKYTPYLPIIARLDGKAFHSFTKGLNKPYDTGFIKIMQLTAKYLAEQTGAVIAYTQSDEISLIWYTNNFKADIFMAGKKSKMTSILASYTTYFFNKEKGNYVPSKKDDMALFDCRVFSVPTKEEACNYLLWREKDATRNSIQAIGQSQFSHKELHEKNSDQIQDMLFQKGINWNNTPPSFKRGTYFQKKITERKFTVEELDKLPEKHEARTNPDLIIKRTDIKQIDMPIFGTVTNKIETVFGGEEPQVQ